MAKRQTKAAIAFPATLFPDQTERKWEVVEVLLADISHGPVPKIAPAFAKSIEHDGVLEPVQLRKESDGTYTIADGRRRIAVLDSLNRASVRAFVLPPLYSSAAVALLLNHQRSGNPFSDFESFEELLQDEGATYATIAERTGIPIGTIKRILKLSNLIVPLYNLARIGKIGTALAFAASSLSVAEQERLAEVYTENQKLTMDDLRALKKARKLRSKTALAALVESADKRAADAGALLRSAIALYEDAGLSAKAVALRAILEGEAE